MRLHIFRLLCWLTGVACLALMAGSQAADRNGARERLDEESGITLLTDASPIVFARTESRYSRSQRDYVYLGPVETNRQGTREYYLWVGVGTTIDRGYLAPVTDTPVKLFIEVHGVPMELELQPWADREPSLSRVRLYKTPVQLKSQLAARVTLDQLMLLGAEPMKSLRVADAAGNTREYFRWGDLAVWPGFLAAAAGAGQ
jgi:hypothetical protein